jgi:hypothetical protein
MLLITLTCTTLVGRSLAQKQNKVLEVGRDEKEVRLYALLAMLCWCSMDLY